MLELLKTLSATPGISGREDAVREVILAELNGVCDIRVDNLGNIIATKKGRQSPKNNVLFSAHMDEVGFIVTYIEDSGLLRFAAVGGIDSRVVAGKTVQVGDKLLPGVVGLKAIHQQSGDEKTAALSMDKLYIDIGAQTKEEAVAHVKLGDPVVFDAPFHQYGEGYLMGRALDDRAGCALLIELLKTDLPCDITCSFTVMEETGCQGAIAVGNQVQPDIAIAIETTTASDIPGVPPEKQVCHLGKGPVLSFMDKGTIYDRALYELGLKVAKENGIPCQSKAGVYGGNESRNLQTAGGGAKTLAVSLPCRYLHSPSCVLKEEDLDNTLKLLRALLEQAAAL